MTEPVWTTSRLRARVPEGWSVAESWTLLAPDGQADVVVAREPLPPGVGTEQYARERGERLAGELPQYQQHVLTVLPLASGWAYARVFSWAAPGGVRVVRVQLHATAPGTGFTATATTSAASFESVAEVVDGVLRSLEFDPGRETGAAPAGAADPVGEPAGATAVRPEPPAQPAPAGATSTTVLAQLPPRPPAAPPPQP